MERKTWNFSHQNSALPWYFSKVFKKLVIAEIFNYELLEKSNEPSRAFWPKAQAKSETNRAEPRLGSNNELTQFIPYLGVVSQICISDLPWKHQQTTRWRLFSRLWYRHYLVVDHVYSYAQVHCILWPYKIKPWLGGTKSDYFCWLALKKNRRSSCTLGGGNLVLFKKKNVCWLRISMKMKKF